VNFAPFQLKSITDYVARFIVVGGDAPIVANKPFFLELEHLIPPSGHKVPLHLEASPQVHGHFLVCKCLIHDLPPALSQVNASLKPFLEHPHLGPLPCNIFWRSACANAIAFLFLELAES
jgi:hypothetical protein